MADRRRILVLGGYGQFGGRISRGLARKCGAELIVAGRSGERARNFVHALRQDYPEAVLRPVVLDHSATTFECDLAALAPSVLVHAAGPYQGQGYRVAEACLRHGTHYVDLSDCRQFLAEFSRLDADAKRSGVVLVAGASTLPAVSSAVVNHLGSGLSAIESIETAILPANRTERGFGTISAVFSYVGKPIQVLQHGEWATKYGWLDLRRVDHPECARWAGLCDVPDLQLFPARYPTLKTSVFHAGLELGWQQLGMWFMAALARLGIVSDWSTHAGVFDRVSARLVSLGSDVGGMQVRVVGRDETGKRLRRTWNLTAGSNHGPEIPCIPARIVAIKLVRNELTQPGATPCMDLMSLEDFEAVAVEFDIAWSFDEKRDES